MYENIIYLLVDSKREIYYNTKVPIETTKKVGLEVNINKIINKEHKWLPIKTV